MLNLHQPTNYFSKEFWSFWPSRVQVFLFHSCCGGRGKKAVWINVERSWKGKQYQYIIILNTVLYSKCCGNCQNIHSFPNFCFLSGLFMIMTVYHCSEVLFEDNSTFFLCLVAIVKVVSMSENWRDTESCLVHCGYRSLGLFLGHSKDPVSVLKEL